MVLPDAGDLIGRQIVHNDDVARLQSWCRHLLHAGEESFSVHRPVEKHGRDKACQCPPTKVMVFQ